MRRATKNIVIAISCTSHASCGSGGQQDDPCLAGGSDPFIDHVDSFEPAPEASFNHDLMPGIVLGPPGGSGEETSADVVSLGCGGSIEVSFDDPFIVDSPGPDFIVFENPFATGDTTFAEPARVSVSVDGDTWHELPCAVDGTESWPPAGCAGVQPVLAGPDNDLDPTDPKEAGGDAFDLEAFGLDLARYVRLVDVTEQYYGDTTWCSGDKGGFDLDAIAVASAGCK